MKEIAEKRLNAKVILCKCPMGQKGEKSSKLFGIRIEEWNKDWLRTWAFKIDAEKAHNKGFDNEVPRGTMLLSSDYIGCPYCGSISIAQCACGKIFCRTDEKTTLTCPWCRQSGEYHSVDKISVQGGDL